MSKVIVVEELSPRQCLIVASLAAVGLETVVVKKDPVVLAELTEHTAILIETLSHEDKKAIALLMRKWSNIGEGDLAL